MITFKEVCDLNNNEVVFFEKCVELSEEIKIYKSLMKKIIKATEIVSLPIASELDSNEKINELFIFNDRVTYILTEQEQKLLKKLKSH